MKVGAIKVTANNKEAMRQENRRHVLSIIGIGSVSRIELVKETGLSRATITEITAELLEDGIIVEAGKKNIQNNLGRKPIALEINPSWGYVIGVNIEREYYEVGLLTIDMGVVGDTVRINAAGSPESILNQIEKEANILIEKNAIDTEKIIGIGAITPGPVDAARGIILNPVNFEPWHDFRLKDNLSRRFPYRVYTHHNATAYTMMENNGRFGNFALYAINNGIGFGLVLNGQAYNEGRNFCCQIAHTSLNLNGRLCPCGNKGCLEMYASVAAVLHEARRVKPEIDKWHDFIDLAYERDPFCNDLLISQAEYISYSIINLNNILELDAVIITGLAAYRGEMLLDHIRRHVNRQLSKENRPELTVINSRIKENIGIKAAGMLVIDELFSKNLYSEIKLAERPQ